MNKAQTNLPVKSNLFQTWNPILTPKKEHLLSQSFFERPLVTHEVQKNKT